MAVRWTHSLLGEPVEILAELDTERFETRKVHVYSNGRIEHADSQTHSEDIELSYEAIPSLEEIASDMQFEPREISKAEFEAIWQLALARRAK